MAATKKKKKATTGPKPLEIHLRMNFSLASAPGVSRWAGDHPVAGATITVSGTAISTKTGTNGNATLSRTGLPANPITLQISPDSTQLNGTGPAGPALLKGTATLPTFMFRPFEVVVNIDPTGFVTSPGPSINFTPTPHGAPSNALVFSVTSSVLALDWKPDWVQTNNHDATRSTPIDCVVIHQTGWPGIIGSVINTFTQAASQASAHYVVDVDGHVVKMVQEAVPSWHAGSSFWKGRTGVNQFSVGIENVHTDQAGTNFNNLTSAPTPYPNEQYDALMRLVQALRTEFPAATRQRVVGHGDVETQGHGHNQIGTSRAGDPGTQFEWTRLEAAHLARTATGFTVPAPLNILYGLKRGGTATLGAPVFSSDVAQLKDDLSSIGYSVSDTTGLPDGPVFSLALTRALSRFQIRYFSLGTIPPAGMTLGILDIGTAEMINRVLQDTLP